MAAQSGVLDTIQVYTSHATSQECHGNVSAGSFFIRDVTREQERGFTNCFLMILFVSAFVSY
jgi:hypothetical protein